MNSATLKTIREQVGLTAKEAAEAVGASLRTWQRWEAADYTGRIPADAVDMLQALLDEQSDMLDAILETIDDEPGPIALTRYRTQDALDRAHPGFPGGLSAHSAAVGAALRELLDEGRDVEVVWDDDPAAVVGSDWS